MESTRVQALARAERARTVLLTHWLPMSAAAIFALTLIVGPTHAAGPATTPVAGQKLDSGLGELPHYSKWADPTGRQPLQATVAGEKLDSGLGDLPHYSKWADPSGRQPLRAAEPATAQRVSLR